MIKNILINFLSQFLTLLVAVVTLPITIRHYGIESYGVISLALSVFGASIILDLGLGRATTKFVAEKSALLDVQGAVNVIWASIALQAGIGVLFGVVCMGIYPQIIGKLPITVLSEAELNVVVPAMAVAFPFILVNASLRGALEGVQRFDLVNTVKLVQNASIYLVPVTCGLLHLGLVSVIVGLCISRIVATVLYLLCCMSVFRGFWHFSVASSLREKRLWHFSGWLALSNIIVALLVQGDRPLLAFFGGAAVVGVYAVPMEIVNGLSVITGCISAVLLPVFSNLDSSKRHSPEIVSIFFRSLRAVLFLLLPIATILLIDSYFVLYAWQGYEVALHCSAPLKVAIVAMVVNAMAWIPTALAIGVGRADIIVKIQIAQIPIMLLLAWYLVPLYGATGAAMVYLARVAFETTFLFWATKTRLLSGMRFGYRSIFRATGFLPLLVAGFGYWIVSTSMSASLGKMLAIAGYSLTYIVCWWTLVADITEKDVIMKLAKKVKIF